MVEISYGQENNFCISMSNATVALKSSSHVMLQNVNKTIGLTIKTSWFHSATSLQSNYDTNQPQKSIPYFFYFNVCFATMNTITCQFCVNCKSKCIHHLWMSFPVVVLWICGLLFSVVSHFLSLWPPPYISANTYGITGTFSHHLCHLLKQLCP